VSLVAFLCVSVLQSKIYMKNSIAYHKSIFSTILSYVFITIVIVYVYAYIHSSSNNLHWTTLGIGATIVAIFVISLIPLYVKSPASILYSKNYTTGMFDEILTFSYTVRACRIFLENKGFQNH
jgi:hypothetical protein